MSTTVAVVANISGEAWAEAPDGTRRPLEAGDALMAGERLITAENAQILLDFGYGETVAFGGGVTILASAEMASDFVASQQDTVVEDDSVAAALASIEEALGGAIEDAEAPAAGLEGGSSGGSSSVRLARIVESIDPAGLDLEFSPYSFNAQIADNGLESGFFADDSDQQPAVTDPGTESPRSAIFINSVEGGSLQSSSVQVQGGSSGMPEGTPVLVTITDQAGNTLTQEVLTGPDGSFTATFADVSGLIDGPFSAQATATDPNGIELSDLANGTLDAIAGDLTVAVDAINNALQTINLSGTTSDVAPGDTVNLAITDAAGNVVTASAAVIEDGSYSIDGINISSLVDGPLNVTASATDRNGNSLSDEAPAGTVLDATDGALSVIVDSVDNTNLTIDLSGTTTDVAPGEIVNVTITDAVGNTVTTTGTVADDGTFDIDDISLVNDDGTVLVDGPLTVSAGTEDRNGNSLDENAPAGTVLDAAGSTLTVVVDGVDNANRTIDLSGSTTDVAPGETVNLTITDAAGNVVETTGTVADDGSFDVNDISLITDDGTALVDGPLTVNAGTEDRNGNSLEGSAPAGSSLDAVDSALTVVVDGVDNANRTIDLSGSTTDVAPGETVTLTITDAAGNVVETIGTVAENGIFNVDGANLTTADGVDLVDGPLTVSATAADRNGNNVADDAPAGTVLDATDSVLTVVVDGVDNVNRTIDLSGSTTDVAPGETVALTITDAAGNVVEATGTVANDGSYDVNDIALTSADGVDLVDGPLTVNASAADRNGNNLADDAPAGTVLDATDSALTVVVDGVDNANRTIDLSGSTTDVAPGETVTLTITDAAGNVVETTSTVANDGSYNVNDIALTTADGVDLVDGPLTVNASAADRNGNSLADDAPAGTVLDATDSALAVVVDGVDNANRTIDLSGSTTDVAPGETVTLTVTDAAGNVVEATGTVANDGSYDINDIVLTTADGVDLVDGPLTVSATAADRNGNNLADDAPAGTVLDATDSALTVVVDGVDNANRTIDLSGTTTDVAPGETVTLTITDAAGNVVEAAGTVANDGSYDINDIVLTTADGVDLVDGPLTVSATAADRNGNNLADDAPAGTVLDAINSALTVVVDDVDNVNRTIDLSGTTTDVAPGETVTLTITDAAGNVVETIGTVAENGIFNVDGANLTTADGVDLVDGPLTVSATAADRNGNNLADDAPAGTVLDATNSALTVVVDDVDNVNRTIDLSGTTTDVAPGETVTLTITDAAGNVVETTGTVAENGTFNVDGVNLTTADGVDLVDGPLTVNATAADRNGNSLDENAPAGTVLDAAGSALTVVVDEVDNDSRTIDLSGSTTDVAPGETVTLTITDAAGNVVETTGTVAENGTFDVDGVDLTTAGGVDLVDGPLTVNATAADRNGNNVADDAPAGTVLDATDSALTVVVDGVDNVNRTIDLSGSTTDVAPGETVALTITDAAGNVVEATGTVANDGSYDINEIALTTADGVSLVDGPLTVQASAEDRNGNKLEANAPAGTVLDAVNDVPLISGDLAGSVTEDAADTLVASGELNATGGDAGENLFNAETLDGTYGNLVIGEDGSWTYSADNSQPVIQSLAAGQTLTETFTVTNADGVTTVPLTITINGANDVAAITVTPADIAPAVTEDDAANNIVTGTVNVTDADAGESTLASSTADYGTVTVNDNSNWTYTLDNGLEAVQALAAGQTLTDTITFTSDDGTTVTQDVIINGANDVAAITVTPSELEPAVTEDDAANNTATGTVNVTDADAGQSTLANSTADYGTVTVDDNGTWTYRLDNGLEAVQALAAGQTLTDTITFASEDGTTVTQDVVINGANDVAAIIVTPADIAPAVTEDDAANNVVTGTVNVTDADAGESTLANSTADYGTVTVDDNGNWTYTLDNSLEAVQALAAGQTLTDTITFTSEDGTTVTQDVIINGANDGAAITVTPSELEPAVTEDDAANNTATGTVNVTDADAGQSTLANSTADYGTVTVDDNGTWTYTLDNSLDAVQALAAGQTLTDTITFTSDDGTTVTQDVIINGANDAAAITVTPADIAPAVTEDDAANNVVTGTVNVTDADAGESTLASSTANYGTVTVDDNGNWTYTLDNGLEAVQALAAGQTLTDTITFTSDDGTTVTQDVIINGANDVAAITVTPADIAPAVTEDDAANNVVTGTVNVTDADAGESTLANSTADYGTVTVDDNGIWTYTLNNGLEAVQALAAGQTLTDTITFTSEDGTTVTQDILINGADDTTAIVVTATDTAVIEDDAANNTATGTVTLLEADADQGTLTSSTAKFGTVTVNDIGNWIYELDNSDAAVQALKAGETMTDTITFTSDDGTTKTQTITITGSNDTPIANNDGVFTIDEDTVLSNINVLGNDTDVDGDDLTVTAATAANGTITINNDGTLNYTPNENFNGDDSITYTVNDGNGGEDTATVAITVNAVNDAPMANDDGVFTTDEDTVLSNINVLGNDTDVDGDDLTVTAATAANGTVTINNDGTLNYTPNANFNGDDSITYTVNDGNGGEDTATVAITVNSVNDAPVANDDGVFSTDEDTVLNNINVLSNDTDVDGDDLTVTAATAANGTITINNDGTLNYTPNENFNGDDSITYTVNDGNGGEDTATVAVTVNAVNDAPVANDDGVFTTDEDTVLNNINVLGNDTDVDGDDLTVTAATAANGTITINNDGTLNYTPNENFNGDDSITYTVNDGNGGEDTATVAITVNAVNDAPVANDDGVFTTDEDTVLSNINVLGNDTDVDGDDLTVTAATAANGTVTINDDGTLNYTPNENFAGKDSITYTVNDGNGGEDTATVAITVNAVNDTPVANNDGVFTTDEDTVLNNINVLSNDTDVDGDDLTVTAATAANGTVTINDDGTLNYTPNENFAGNDSITYTVNDGNGGTDTATVAVTVNAVNDAPVANDDGVFTTDEDTVLNNINVLSNDTDVDGDDLTVTAATAANGTVTINNDGTLNYTPNENFAGNDSITYTVNDGNGGEDTATVAITVNAVNDAPMANDDGVFTTDEDTVLSNINVLGNDTDVDGDDLTVTAATAANGTVTINNDGTLNYTPNANFNGDDSITYTVNDGNGGEDTATVAITVNAVNDAPVANDDGVFSTDEDTVLNNINVLSNDTDVDGDDLTVTAATAANGTVTINNDGTLNYTPNANFNGDDSITYTVNDGNGSSDTASVAITVNSVNDAPVANDDGVFSTDEDTVLNNINVLSNDTDVDGDDLTVTAATAANGTVTINNDGTLNYTPNENFAGNDSITYTVNDGNGGEDTATVAITVNAVNDAPVANDDGVFTTDEDTVLSNINVLGNDTDVDGDDLTVTAATAANGTVTINNDGTLNYTPNENFAGNDSITYTVNDGNGGEDTATVAITVNAVNDTPVANNDGVFTTDEDTVLSNINVLGNDTDVDGDDLTVTAATAANGTVTINNDGTLNYTPNENFAGNDSITYTVNDGNGGEDTATVAITVNAVNDTPVANNDGVFTTDEDTVLSNINVLGNDTDVDGDDLTVTAATAANGTVTINDDGTLDYTPAANFAGNDAISYTVSDGNGGFDTATVKVTVKPVNDAGSVSISGTALEGETLTANVNDADGTSESTISYQWFADGAAISGATASRYTLTASEAGSKITVQASYTDSQGFEESPTSGSTGEVIPLNEAPEATDDTYVIDIIPGLSGQYWSYNPGQDKQGSGRLKDLSQAEAFIEANPHDATFVSTEINYGAGNVNLGNQNGLEDFLRADSESIIGDPGNSPDAIIRMTGELQLESGTYTFKTTADEGFIGIRINGEVMLKGDEKQTSDTQTFKEFTVDSDGPSFVEIIFWDQGGRTPLKLEIVDENNNSQILGSEQASFKEVNEALVTDENQALIIAPATLLSNDADPDGGDLTIKSVQDAENGTVTLDSSGNIVFVPEDQFFGDATFSYTLSDGQGGEDTASVTVNVRPNANADALSTSDFASNHVDNTIIGDEHTNTLLGTSGNDVLTGGAGDDVLTGGMGADVFQWELGDEGADSMARDTVTDFTTDPAGYTGSGQGDQLELSDLLQDASTGTITDYLMAQEENGDTVLYVNKDGALEDSSDNAQQSITLSGVTMDGQTSEQFIDTLVNSGHIKIE